MNIIQKLRKAKLTGRGGAGFPTADKWEMVKNSPGAKKFVICNSSEGEPGILKDRYLLEHRADYVMDGILLAMSYLNAERGYIYMNPEYYKAFGKNLKKLINNLPIEVFCKAHAAGYIGGEETSALNHIEGKRVEPRFRPPYPPEHGLWGYPTLVNNVETFYAASLINSDRYTNTRFYTIGGACVFDGVYELPEDIHIDEIMRQTDNYPDFDFFVQVGGDASGEIFNSTQLKRPVPGDASVTIHSLYKHNPLGLIRYWLDFYFQQSCGKCTPCREGIYRLRELIGAENIDWWMVARILECQKESSFCALGASIPSALTSYVQNILKFPEIKVNMMTDDRQRICDCF